MITLAPKQQQAVDKLVRVLSSHAAAGNWSRTGTGKTLMNLSVAGELGWAPLIVAPLAAHAAWKKWSRELGVPILDVVNCEKLRTGKTPWASIRPNPTGRGDPSFVWNLAPRGSARPNIVLWDEIHRGLTGANTVTGRMAATLRPQKISVVLASATPFSSPLNARASGYLFQLHNWSAASFFSWCRAHGCRPSPFHRGLTFDPGSASGKFHMERINTAIRDRCVALQIEDIAHLFPDGNIVEPKLIQLSERDETEARRIYEEMDERLKKAEYSTALEEKLRARQRCELLKVPALAELVQDAVEEGENVFVALGFRDSVDRLMDVLRENGMTSAVCFHGGLSDTARMAARNMFQEDLARVFVATIQAGGESIDLHQHLPGQRPRTSLICPTYSASQLVQALGRIKRANMITPVVQRIVLCAGTIEERIAANIQAKIAAIDTLTDADLE